MDASGENRTSRMTSLAIAGAFGGVIGGVVAGIVIGMIVANAVQTMSVKTYDTDYYCECEPGSNGDPEKATPKKIRGPLGKCPHRNPLNHKFCDI